MKQLSINDRNGSAKTVPAHADGDGNIETVVSTDGSVETYRAGGVLETPVTNPTAWLRVKGSATRTVRIRKIVIQGVATAAGNMPVVVDKNSSLGTDNASTVWGAATVAPLDSENVAATAVVEVLTGANQDALGTSVGKVGAGRVQLAAAGSGVAIVPFELNFGTGGQQAVVLRGASETVTVGFAGATVPAGATLDYYVEWTEETE